MEEYSVFLPLVVDSWPIQTDITCVQGEGITALSLPDLAYGRSAINVSIFRREALLSIEEKQLIGYLTAAGDIALVVRGPANIAERLTIPGPMSERMLGDGHQGLNMGYSEDGFVHLVLGAHATSPFYYNLAWPGLEIITQDTGRLALPSERISYPQFYELGGELILFFRDDSSKTYSLNRYDSAAGEWNPWIVPLLTTPSEVDRIYTNGLAIEGERIALAYTWRYYPDSPDPDDYEVLNEGWRVILSEDRGLTWQAFDGQELSLPIATFTPTIAYLVPVGQNLSNQAGSWLGSDGVLRVSYFADDAEGVPQTFVTEFDLLTKQVTPSLPVSDNTIDFDLSGAGTLSLPLSRPAVFSMSQHLISIYRQENTIRAAWRSVYHPTAPWDDVTLCTGFVENWEPILDYGLIEGDRINLYIQGAKQGPRDTNYPSELAAPAMLLDLSADALATMMPLSENRIPVRTSMRQGD